MYQPMFSFFRRFAAIAALLLALPVFAAEGYAVFEPARPTENPDKIEVIEFFYYTCSFCKTLNSPLAAWAAKQPKDVVLRRIPVTFGKAALGNLARLYYSLEAMGELDRLDPQIFEAMHEQRINLILEQKMFEWLANKGVNTQKFAGLFKSFGVESKIRRGDQLERDYQINGVPALVIDGKYMPDPAPPEKLLAVTDQLIAKVRMERAAKKK
ncbi:MAG: Thiol:disulfide interchange protein DsbA precursor [Betaproteobacteria bacterium ADurb.Bin341]|nr:MAG: Thiol:disulfide interchange protein DsbA precursor [Betaproteobacteria bacterium ADurb.Bin341]